jgi:hypothetical protein
MLAEITRRTMVLLSVRAWRNYGAMLLCAAVPFGLLELVAQHGWLPALVVAALAWPVLVGALTAATFAARWRSARTAVVAHHVCAVAPRALLHASIAASPLLLVVAALVLANWAHPMLTLALVPIAFVALAVVGVAVLLAIAGVVMGDRASVPAIAVTLARKSPWKLASGLVALGGPIAFGSLPVACAGLILMALPGPFGWLGIGIALAAPLPFYGALAVAAWRVLGGGALDAGAHPDRGIEPATPTVTGAYHWQAGPAWQVVLDPMLPWGTWIDLPPDADGSTAPRTIGVTVEAVGVTMPRLLSCDEAGTWLEWPVPHAGGTVLPIQLPVGASYLQLVSTAQVACHARMVISTQVWVEGAGTAAA